MGSKDANLKKRKKKLSNEKKRSKETSNSHSPPVAPVRHGGEGTAGDGSGGHKVITDPRFSSLHTDPRFREAPKHKSKVAIDSRFDRMFTDKSFISSSAPVDKRGKYKKSNSQQSTLRHYHKIIKEAKRRKDEEVEQSSDEEDEEKEEEVEESSDEEDDEKEEDVEESSDEEDDEKEEEVEESSDEYDEMEDEVDEFSEEADEEEKDGKEQKLVKPKSLKSGDDTEDESESDMISEESEEEKEAIAIIKKETHRLAIVNMDWRHVKAVDLYAILSSFVPPNGHIKSVAIYPSEFGLQRMKKEEVHGPVALFDDENDNSEENSGDEDQYHKKLLDYEKDRMRYYFAVAECDSVNTADYIYKECDGFMVSLNPLDLRFIPDSMEFKHPPRDVATEVPANYDYVDFSTGALQHTDVKLTWEEDEPDRAKTLRRKFTDEELAELELKELLASDESESDDENKNETEFQPDKKALYDKYRDLLLSGNSSGEEGEEGGQDMEVTFNTGLEGISKQMLEKKDEKAGTVWAEQLRKRRERKIARKNKSKYSSDVDGSDDADQEVTRQEDDFFLEEPASKKRKGKGKFEKEQKPQDMDGVDEASKQELELLLADDRGAETSLKGYNLKLKTANGKKGREAIKEEKLPSTYVDDPRFAAISNPAYAIDPTDPQFKRSAAYYRQLALKEQKVDAGSLAEGKHMILPGGKQLQSEDVGVAKRGEKDGSDVSKSKEKYELSSLVKSIKQKSKQVQLPSDGKTERNGKVKIRRKEM